MRHTSILTADYLAINPEIMIDYVPRADHEYNGIDKPYQDCIGKRNGWDEDVLEENPEPERFENPYLKPEDISNEQWMVFWGVDPYEETSQEDLDWLGRLRQEDNSPDHEDGDGQEEDPYIGCLEDQEPFNSDEWLKQRYPGYHEACPQVAVISDNSIAKEAADEDFEVNVTRPTRIQEKMQPQRGDISSKKEERKTIRLFAGACYIDNDGVKHRNHQRLNTQKPRKRIRRKDCKLQYAKEAHYGYEDTGEFRSYYDGEEWHTFYVPSFQEFVEKECIHENVFAKKQRTPGEELFLEKIRAIGARIQKVADLEKMKRKRNKRNKKLQKSFEQQL